MRGKEEYSKDVRLVFSLWWQEPRADGEEDDDDEANDETPAILC